MKSTLRGGAKHRCACVLLQHSRLFLLSSGLALSALSAAAQTPAQPPNLPSIDAREQQLQQERERALREQQEKTPDVRLQPSQAAPAPRIPEKETPCFPIQRIQLIGQNTDAFQWALEASDEDNDSVTGRCLGTQGINIVMGRIQNAIVQRGYVTTRVLASDQDLQSGTLTLTLVVGRIHAIRFVEGTSDYAHSFNAMPMKEGDLLNLREIEQALENFKRIPTVEADIQIIPTEGSPGVAGESDLLISWKQNKRWRISLSADDSGSRSTGQYQGTATLSLDNPLSLNDLFYASYNHALDPMNSSGRSTDGYSFFYSMPMGNWAASANYSNSYYFQTVAGYSQNYEYSGKSENSELKLTRMMWRDATSKTSLGLKGWFKTSSTYIDDTEIQVQRRRTAGWGAEINHRHFIGSATLDMTLDYKHGTGAMGSLSAPEQAFNEGTSQMRILTLNAQLDIPFQIARQNLQYTTTWRQQWNGTPLTSQDRFSIGNRFTVRGFDGELTLMGERGMLWRNDLSLAIPAIQSQLYLGLDAGHVDGFPTEQELGKTLAGCALGLRGSYWGIGYDFFIGAPIYKPKGFVTSDVTLGFNLSWSY